MQERIPRIEERVSALDKDVLSLSEDLNGLKAEVRSAESTIKRLDTDVELLKQQGMTVEQALREIKTEIKELTVLLREMAQTVEECLERLKNDDTRPDKELETERIKEWFETYGDQEKSEERKEIMKRKLETRQYRSLLLNLDAKSTEKRIESDHYVEGYATTFEPYLLWEDESGPIYEEFSAECFRDTDMSDVILQFDHMGRVYARQSNGSLIVEVDDKGLFIAADLSRSTGARELYQEIKEGLITKMSWGFRLGDYEFDKETNTIKHQSIKKVFDVSAVSIPANGGTEINARALVDGVIRQRLVEDQERKKLALKLKLALEGE